jgi:hypothetical protein
MPKNRKAKRTVEVRDIKPRKNPKGGALDSFLKIGSFAHKGESLQHRHK